MEEIIRRLTQALADARTALDVLAREVPPRSTVLPLDLQGVIHSIDVVLARTAEMGASTPTQVITAKSVDPVVLAAFADTASPTVFRGGKVEPLADVVEAEEAVAVAAEAVAVEAQLNPVVLK